MGCEDGERGIPALDVIFHGAEYLLIQRHHVHHHLLLKFDWLKHTVLLLAESATPAEENSALFNVTDLLNYINCPATIAEPK